MDTRKNSEQLTMMIVCIFGFAILIKILVGVGYFNDYDTYWYRTWAVDLPNGFFNVYARADSISLNYPPLYLIPLYITGLAYKVFTTSSHQYIQMMLLKFWPVLFDVLCAVVLYRICKKYGEMTGLFAATLWLLNPSMFFNSTMWGQTDSVMAFLLILSFWFLEEDRPILASILFAVAGLTKFQSLFFIPVFLLELAFKYKADLKRLFLSLGAAAATVVTVFLPFMIGARNPMLFFDIYLGGKDTYPFCSLYAFNLYGMAGKDWSTGVRDTDAIIGFFTYKMFSNVLLVLSVAFIIFLYAKGKRRSGWVGGLLFMQCVFMLTTRMHERYQIIVLPFALMAYIVSKNKGFLLNFFGLSAITAINQALVLFRINVKPYAPWYQHFNIIIIVLSTINMILFLWTINLCVTYFLSDNSKTQKSIQVPEN